jgi:hypothetical protein
MKHNRKTFSKALPHTALILATAAALVVLPELSSASTTGGEFQVAYDFFNNAATGYLGRGIAIVGGIIGLGLGAAKGSALPAIIGVILAIFGALGPGIVDAIFNSAII